MQDDPYSGSGRPLYNDSYNQGYNPNYSDHRSPHASHTSLHSDRGRMVRYYMVLLHFWLHCTHANRLIKHINHTTRYLVCNFSMRSLVMGCDFSLLLSYFLLNDLGNLAISDFDTFFLFFFSTHKTYLVTPCRNINFFEVKISRLKVKWSYIKIVK